MSTNPYASPAGDAGELRIGTGQQRPPWPYRPAGLLTAWLTGVLWALIAAYFAALVLQIVGATVLADDLTFLVESEDFMQVSSTAWGYFGALICTGLLIALGQLACVVLFCVWVNRANKNARALGAREMSYSPGWSAGWFFVPVANLWMPYKAVREIYLASRPGAGGTEWRFVDPPALLRIWWTLWLLSIVVNRASEQMSESTNLQTMLGAFWVGAAACGLSIGAAYSCLRVVRSIHDRQQQTAAELSRPAEAAWS